MHPHSYVYMLYISEYMKKIRTSDKKLWPKCMRKRARIRKTAARSLFLCVCAVQYSPEIEQPGGTTGND